MPVGFICKSHLASRGLIGAALTSTTLTKHALSVFPKKYNMATSKIGEMPLQFLEVEQYFKCLQFFPEASEKLIVSKAVLLSSCGQTAFSLIETLIAPADIAGPDVAFNVIRDAVVNHLRPKRNLHYERHLLHPQSSDTISTFVQHLKDQANKCDFGELCDELILSHFVFGLSDHTIRSKLLSTADLTLDYAIQQAMLCETVELASGTVNSAISALAACKPSKQSCADDIPAKPHWQKPSFSPCFSCGSTAHQRSACRFRQATCHVCGKNSHISTVCRSSSRTSNALPISNSDHNESDLTMAIDGVVLKFLVGGKDNLWRELYQISGTMVDFLIDTGSQVTILPASSAALTGLPVEPAPFPCLTSIRRRKSSRDW